MFSCTYFYQKCHLRYLSQRLIEFPSIRKHKIVKDSEAIICFLWCIHHKHLKRKRKRLYNKEDPWLSNHKNILQICFHTYSSKIAKMLWNLLGCIDIAKMRWFAIGIRIIKGNCWDFGSKKKSDRRWNQSVFRVFSLFIL